MSTIIGQSNVNPKGDGYDDDGSERDVVVKASVYLAGHRFGFQGVGTTNLYNYGRIYGGINAVLDSAVVVNFGQIRSNATGVRVLRSFYNYGTILSNGADVYLDGYFRHFVNEGTMRGGIGILSSGIAGQIVNRGTIDGSAGPGNSDALDLALGSHFSLVNSGTVIGAVSIHQVLGNPAAKAAITNTGAIQGDVVLNPGNNSTLRYDGRQGTISGTVDIETGTTVFRAGDDGETVRTFGNAPAYIYEGGGADTIALDASLGHPRWTYVAAFDTSQDHIELDHNIEKALTPGQAPAFAIATAATSASDHLFLNPNSGVLYYDPDGSGSQATTALPSSLAKRINSAVDDTIL